MAHHFSTPRHAPVDNGFTVLELLITLAIAVMALSFATLGISGVRDTAAFRAAVTDLATALTNVRSHAVATGTSQTLSFDSGAQSYWTAGDQPPRRLPSGISATVDGPALATNAELGRHAIRFRPNGSAGAHRFVVRAAGQHAEIDVNWLTGQVSVTYGR